MQEKETRALTLYETPLNEIHSVTIWKFYAGLDLIGLFKSVHVRLDFFTVNCFKLCEVRLG